MPAFTELNKPGKKRRLNMGNTKNVLIVSPFSENGDLICRSISKLPSVISKSVSTLHGIAKYIDLLIESDSILDLILFDMEIGVARLRDSIFIVREKFPSVHITLIAKNGPSEEMDSLKPWNLLRKPFVENDLLESIKSTLNQKKISVIDGSFKDSVYENNPVWARDKKRLVTVMEDAMENLDAQEAILITANEIIASVGSLQANEKENCSQIIKEYMDFSGHGELIKQVKLSENSYLVHALALTVGIIIALIFDPDTSYELIRGQTRNVAGKITKFALPEEVKNNQNDSDRKQITSPVNQLVMEETEKVAQPAKIKEFDQKREVENILVNPVFDKERTTRINLSDQNTKAGLDFSNKTSEAEKKENKVRRNSIISVGLSQLPFTCLLIPRLNPKFIPDDIIEYLAEKTPLIFLSYGWKLNDILIKKDMMQWIAAIPPIISPAFQIKTIRRETSKLIFERFPKISMDGLMKDFWVPGYLVAIGSERISEQEKEELIENSQQRYVLDGPGNISAAAQKVLYNNF